MLRVTRVLCLILAATVTSVSAGHLVFSARKSFNSAVLSARKKICYEYYSIIHKLADVYEMIASKLAQMGQQEEISYRQMVSTCKAYDHWETTLRQNLSEVHDMWHRHLSNSQDEVNTYESMCTDNRIGDDQAAKFIKENKRQLKNITRSTMSTFKAVGKEINETMSNWNEYAPPDVSQ